MRISEALRKTSPSRGFTLTELAVVMLVVGIMSGMALVSLNGLQASRQDVAATRIRSALIHAQRWARGSNNDTWVVFDVAGDLVSVFVEDPFNPGRANRLTLADPLTRSAMTVQLGGDGVGIESATFGATDEVQFDALGVPYDENGTMLAADGTVSVTGGITIRVTKSTGLVTVD